MLCAVQLASLSELECSKDTDHWKRKIDKLGQQRVCCLLEILNQSFVLKI